MRTIIASDVVAIGKWSEVGPPPQFCYPYEREDMSIEDGMVGGCVDVDDGPQETTPTYDSVTGEIAHAQVDPDPDVVAVRQWAKLQSEIITIDQKIAAMQNDKTSRVAAREHAEKLLSSAAGGTRHYHTDYGIVCYDPRASVRIRMLDCKDAREE